LCAYSTVPSLVTATDTAFVLALEGRAGCPALSFSVCRSNLAVLWSHGGRASKRVEEVVGDV